MPVLRSRRPLPILLALVAACGERGPREEMPVVVVERDFLEPGTWEVVRARADAPPSVQALTPSLAPGQGDMPALVVPPPGVVKIEVPAGAVPARLMTRVGVDALMYRGLTEAEPSLRIVFEARAGERLLAREELELVRERHAENAWRDLGGPEGLALDVPQTITLHTSAVWPDGRERALPHPVQAGFGGLRLERRLARTRTRSSPRAPNVVLVVMDTLRADRLSTYGYAKPTAPHLDALAARGTRFEACYSTASWTWPATASLLTGLTPAEHRVINEGASYLVEAAPTLAEALQRAGLTTAAWSANPIVSPARNFDQGFERFEPAGTAFRKTQEFFEEVRAFLRERRDTRFFLYLHLADPHTPLRPLPEGLRAVAPEVPPGFAERSDRLYRATSKGQAVKGEGELDFAGIATPEERAWTSQLYDASVWSGDHWLGALVAELAALELTDRTVVAFTSDHGEELFERGFLGHGQSVRSELVRVPLVVAGPGVPAGRVEPGAVSARVVAPLLAGLAGVAFDSDARALGVLREGRRFEELVTFTTRKGSWKGRNLVHVDGALEGALKLELARNGAPWGAAAPSEEGDCALFDLRADPGETRDLSAARKAEAARLRAALDELLASQHRIGYDVPAGGLTQKMLEDLGYSGDGH
ncbi:MAG TPA: sulfatase [Planctomycetota bacterium]